MATSGDTHGRGAAGRAAIDLNADVGEQVSRDGDGPLLALVSSASVACGFHAGDATTMRATCALAAAHGVRIGAHVGYDDREGFGRRELEQAARRITDEVVYQLGALRACAAVEGAAVRYVKPHGALYARAGRDPELARLLAAALAAIDAGLAVMTPSGSELARAAAAMGLGVIAEGFADRGYARDGGLRARSEPGAVLGAQAAAAQAVALATTGRLTTADGVAIAIDPESLCVHSDSPDVLAIASAVRAALAGAGVEIAAGP